MHAPVPMHIPDGFLSITTSVLFWIFSAIVLFFALRKSEEILSDKKIPLMGVMAAAIFAGQMLNFAVTGGTSGHLLGAALAVIMVGTWPAVIVMASVVIVQALMFQDGGLVVMGANLFNMAVVGVFTANFIYSIFSRLYKHKKWALTAAAFAAGWASVFIASLSAGLQLAVSGTSPANIAIPAMAGIHALIGVGEGLITAGAAALVLKARPDLIDREELSGEDQKWVVTAGIVLSLLLVIISPLASSRPDGLEFVAERLGFMIRAQEPAFEIIPDYVLPGPLSSALATVAAGVIGIIIVAGLALAASKMSSKG